MRGLRFNFRFLRSTLVIELAFFFSSEFRRFSRGFVLFFFFNVNVKSECAQNFVSALLSQKRVSQYFILISTTAIEFFIKTREQNF